MDARTIRPLVEAFVWPLVFFELCDDETLDPDIAVQQMEQIADALRDLAPTERNLVVQVLGQLAQEAEQPNVRALIEEIAREIGLIDETQR